jgi:serine/threonine protein kinase
MKKIKQENREYEFSEKDRLGNGSFADVYKGKKLDSGEIVAIKVIKKETLKRYGDEILRVIGNEVNIL